MLYISHHIKGNFIEGNFCFFYPIACHFLVRSKGKGGRGKWQIWHGKRLERGSKNAILRETSFLNGSYVKILKKICIFDPQTVIYNKLLFFLQMENWLLVNRSFNDDSGKPVRAIAVRSSALCTFTEDCNSSVSSSAIQFFTVSLPMICQY